MKKRLMGILLAGALLATQMLGVSAAGSKTAGFAPAGDSVNAYNFAEITEDSMQELKESNPEVFDLVLAINADTKTLEDLAEAAPELASVLEGKSMLTKFVDVTPINDGIKLDNGDYQVNMSVPALSSAASDVQLVHFSTERNEWEIITPSKVDTDNKELTAEFKDLSPVAVIAKVDADKAADNQVGTSPKTGVVSTWGIFAAAAVVLLGGAVVLGIRRKEN